jgi:hypothetical protein
MTSAFQCRHQHNYRLSAYERKVNEFYPTPSELAISLAVGLSKLGLDLPRVASIRAAATAPSAAIWRTLGVDVRLSDLYPERYLGADGYFASQPLDAAEPEQLGHALTLAGPHCAAIITNTSNDALWRNGSCSAIVPTTGNCRARWAVEATGNEYHPWPLRCQPFYRAARPRTGEGGLNGAPIPDEKSCRLEGSSKKNRQ